MEYEVYIGTTGMQYDREVVAVVATVVGKKKAEIYDSGSGFGRRDMHFGVSSENEAKAVEAAILKANFPFVEAVHIDTWDGFTDS